MTSKYRLHRLSRTAHGWAGAALSLILIVIALTGSLLVFKGDYIRTVVPEARQNADLSLSALAAVTEKTEQAFEAENLRALVYATEDFGLHKAYLTDGRAAYLAGDGAVIDVWEQNGRFEDWLFDLHHRLLAGRIGALVAGFSGLAALILIVTGLMAVWPMRRGLKRGLKISNSSRSQVLSVHRNLGVYAALPLFLIILTGVILTFPKQSRAIFDAVGGPEALDPSPFTPAKVDWLSALEQSSQAFETAVPRMAIWGGSERPATLRLKQDQEFHPNGRTLMVIDPGSSQILNQQDALAMGLGREAYNAVYPIHAAHIGGRIYDVAVFLIGLALSALGVLGLFAYVRRYIQP